MPLPAGRPDDPFVVPPASEESRDRAWIEAIRTGDAAAFEAMFRAYAAPLCGFVHRYVRSPEEAQELVQDLFLWIWDHRHEWEVHGSLPGYLYRAARNRAISHMRHAALEARFQERSAEQLVDTTRSRPTPDADQDAAVGELAAALERAIAELPPRCREVFELNRKQHLSYAEIADLLRISPRTVEVHMGRALTALRRSLADWT